MRWLAMITLVGGIMMWCAVAVIYHQGNPSDGSRLAAIPFLAGGGICLSTALRAWQRR